MLTRQPAIARFIRHAVALSGPLAILCAASPGLAQTIFTSDTTITAADASHDGQNIIVRGCTVTIDGTHSFSSLSLEAVGTGSVVTHSPGASMTLTIAANVVVQPGCSISVDGRGYGSDAGAGAGVAGTTNFSGGGGYGGRGGNGSELTAVGGGVYGSVFQPVDRGSGGGTDPYYHQPGGNGGGAVHLTIGGTLTLDGALLARGYNGGNNGYSGAGAGGSLWVSAPSISGAGTISANGGDAPYGGGGGGGRIALYYTTLSIPVASITANGSLTGGTTGGAGTVYLKQGTLRGTIYIDNGGRPRGATTGFPGATTLDANMVVRNNGQVGPGAGETGMSMNVLGDLTVESTGYFSADGQGFIHDAGPGAGIPGITNFGGGGGYGGHGGNGSEAAAVGGDVYGSVFQPVDLGSGGATDPYYHQPGGGGGGAVRLTVGGTLTVDGILSARGSSGGSNGYSGAGAGGSLWISAGAISGSGSISASGGDSPYGGGGGGGRVALYYTTLTMPITNVTAYGSLSGGTTGGAGTVFLKQGSGRGTIYIDNGGRPATFNTGFPGVNTLDANVVIRGNGSLGTGIGELGMSLTILGDLLVDTSGSISADGRGFAHDAGPGAGVTGITNFGGGGGHGGRGGDGSEAAAVGGGAYGSAFQPAEFGSGGATDPYYHQPGGAGGGNLRLVVNGVLTVNGSISARGSNGGNNGYSGAGAGGSLWITTGGLGGTGTITANGGDTPYGGNGGGGRIAVYYSTLTMPVTSINAFGGALAGAGTVYLKQGASRGTIYIDQGGRSRGATTGFPGNTALDADMVVKGNGSIGPGAGETGTTLNVMGDLLVASDGRISADARGYAGGTGPGHGVTGATNFGGGGGYGGRGGDGSEPSALGGGVYGSFFQPVDLGSGGAADAYFHQPGGAGGGAIRLIVGGTLTINGVISANGGAGGANGYSGAGSGGSLWINAGTVNGTGAIQALGGGTPYGGGGGGGRIAILLCGSQVSPTVTVTAAGGTGGAGNSQAGTVFSGPPDFFIVSNPKNAPVCPNGTASFSIGISGGTPSYRWQIETAPAGSNIWTDLSDGPLPGSTTTAAFTGTATLVLNHTDQATIGQRFRCRVSVACGSINSAAATLVPNSGDFNGDGDVGTDADIEAFFACLAGSCCPTCGSADFNGDGDIGTDADIESFFRVLAGGPC